MISNYMNQNPCDASVYIFLTSFKCYLYHMEYLEGDRILVFVFRRLRLGYASFCCSL